MRYKQQKEPHSKALHMDKQADADTKLLLEHGWVRKGQQRYQFGYIQYWDHAEHQRTDGLWYTKGDAVRLQRALLKRNSPTLEEE